MMNIELSTPATIEDAVFPKRPGVYIVRQHGKSGALYVGVAASQTLAARWTRQHLSARAGGSALRRTLGVYLGLVSEKLRRPARYYASEVEFAITAFLRRQCTIEFVECDTAEDAQALERSMITDLNPVLNVRR